VFDTGAGRLSKYIDGQLLSRQTISGVLDGRYSLDSTALLFTDDDGETAVGYVNSIRFVSGTLTDSEVAQLGAASAEGIGIESQPVLNIATQGGDIVITVSEPGQFQLLGKTSLTDRDWIAEGQPFTGKTTVHPDGITGFWRAQKVQP
jgi:hypothetical protein